MKDPSDPSSRRTRTGCLRVLAAIALAALVVGALTSVVLLWMLEMPLAVALSLILGGFALVLLALPGFGPRDRGA